MNEIEKTRIKRELANALMDFVRRETKEPSSVETIKILPEMARLLTGICS